MTPDTAALRAALEREIAVLVPAVTHLRAATAHPPISPHDWHGPAAAGYGELEQRLRAALVAAEDAAGAALHAARLALVQPGG